MMPSYFLMNQFMVSSPSMRCVTPTRPRQRVAAAWVWEEHFGPGAEARGDVLRREVSKLGVVFVKVAQTLATREDLVGAEAAAALSVLQDANKPFDERG